LLHKCSYAAYIQKCHINQNGNFQGRGGNASFQAINEMLSSNKEPDLIFYESGDRLRDEVVLLYLSIIQNNYNSYKE